MRQLLLGSQVRKGGELKRVCFSLCFFVLSLLCSASVLSASAVDDVSSKQKTPTTVAEWLGKMDEALEHRQYVGRLVHQAGDEVRQVRLMHAWIEGERYLRIQHLGDGPASEIVLRGDEFICLHPNLEADEFRQVRLVESGRFRNLAERLPELSEHYTFSLLARKTICGREAVGIDIQARDRYRLHHRLWLDAKTGLLLKGAVISHDQVVLEQFEFVELDPDAVLSARNFEVEVQEAKRFFSVEAPSSKSAVQPNTAILTRLTWLPPGFQPAQREVRKLSGWSRRTTQICGWS